MAPHSHLSINSPALKVIDNPIPKLVLKESAKMYEEQSACYNYEIFNTHATCMHDI